MLDKERDVEPAMTYRLKCPHGHQWALTLDELNSRDDASVVCPSCGAICPPPSLSTRNDATLTLDAATFSSVETKGALAIPVIPGYEVLDLLGQGGMGQVYRARHVRLNRLVAIKQILGSAHASARQLIRFQGEAEALASLQHPNIVQIHEVGEIEHCPYLVLELVEGGSLDRMIGGKPQPPLESARLVATLASAMHSAHQRGIIHRDLKPANVMLQAITDKSTEGVNGKPSTTSAPWATHFIPKIMDFGLAKRFQTDSTQTADGTILGTPSYMAPEQAMGDMRAVGVLADVYALGAILYELLTGRPPFQGSSMLETLEQVRTSALVSPRRLQRAVPRDLETISLKCLEKEPGRRYASAEALAADLQRFLDHEPLLARPVGTGERLVKWMRRRPARAALVAVILLAAVIVAGVGLWSYHSLHVASERLDERYRFTRQILNDVYAKAAEEILADEPHSDALRKDFLENLLRFYEEFTRDGSRGPKVQQEMGLAHFRMGQIYRALDRSLEAESAYRRAIELQEDLCLGQPDSFDCQRDLANSYNWLGELHRESGRPIVEAEQLYQQALKLQQVLNQSSASAAGCRKEMARSLTNLGIVAMDTGRAREAGQHFDLAIDLLTQMHKAQPADLEYRHELARGSINRGILLKDNDQSELAEVDYRLAVDLLTGLIRNSGARANYKFDLAVARQNLGNLLWATYRPKEAIAELEATEDLLTALTSDFPARSNYRKKLANTLNSLGTVQAALGLEPLAEHSWQRAVALSQDLIAESPENVSHRQYLGMAQGNLGWLKLRTCVARSETGELPGACAHLEAAVESLNHVLDRNPRNPEIRHALCNQHRNLAETFIHMQDHARAAAAAHRMAELSPDRAQARYFAACFIARALSLIEKDPQLTEPVRSSHRKQYQELAIELLAGAIADRTAIARLPEEADIFRLLGANAHFARLISDLDERAAIQSD